MKFEQAETVRISMGRRDPAAFSEMSQSILRWREGRHYDRHILGAQLNLAIAAVFVRSDSSPASVGRRAPSFCINISLILVFKYPAVTHKTRFTCKCSRCTQFIPIFIIFNNNLLICAN